ncbi:MAG: hypothetical protein NTY38_17350 [Acidobacteria bacterium]|nr:hypothetical protein [Acidobacteriota bacterium]
MKLLPWLYLYLGSFPAAAQERIVVRQDLLGKSGRDVVIAGRLSDHDVIKLARDYLGEPAIRLARLVVYDSTGASDLEYVRQETHCRPETVENRVPKRDGVPVCPTVREVLKVGGDMVLRSNRDGLVTTRQVLQGTDPLGGPGRGWELIGLTLMPQPGASREEPRVELRASVFVRLYGNLTEELTAASLKHFQEMSGLPEMTVTARKDTMFLWDCEFPVVDLCLHWGSRGLPDAADGRLRATEIWCFASEGEAIRCYRPDGTRKQVP